VIHGTGDVSLDPGYIPAFRSNGYAWAWSGLDGLFRRDDLTIINHECPSTDVVDPIQKTFSFRCDPRALDEARRAGVEVASLANNHGFDQGPDGLLDSLRNLERADIVPLGAGTSEREADAPRYVEVKGWRIGSSAWARSSTPTTRSPRATRSAPQSDTTSGGRSGRSGRPSRARTWSSWSSTGGSSSIPGRASTRSRRRTA
jgi:poly-gamma-glutamate capsule biosynthesis protein CapA/YwtB (metallophosphatase superfamily)